MRERETYFLVEKFFFCFFFIFFLYYFSDLDENYLELHNELMSKIDVGYFLFLLLIDYNVHEGEKEHMIISQICHFSRYENKI